MGERLPLKLTALGVTLLAILPAPKEMLANPAFGNLLSATLNTGHQSGAISFLIAYNVFVILVLLVSLTLGCEFFLDEFSAHTDELESMFLPPSAKQANKRTSTCAEEQAQKPRSVDAKVQVYE